MLISLGDLMFTDLYHWQGQYGTLDWRQIISLYDCTSQFTYYLTHIPTPPDYIPPYVPPYVNPPIALPITPPPSVTAVPELSTWLMMIVGLVSLLCAKHRGVISTLVRTWK